MTIPSSPISFSAIASEFNSSDYSLQDYYTNGSIVQKFVAPNVPTGGTISFSEFGGVSTHTVLQQASSNTYRYSAWFGYSIDICTNPWRNSGYALSVTIGTNMPTNLSNLNYGAPSVSALYGYANNSYAYTETHTQPIPNSNVGTIYYGNPNSMYEVVQWNGPAGKHTAWTQGGTGYGWVINSSGSQQQIYFPYNCLYAFRVNSNRTVDFFLNTCYCDYTNNSYTPFAYTGDNGTSQTIYRQVSAFGQFAGKYTGPTNQGDGNGGYIVSNPTLGYATDWDGQAFCTWFTVSF